MPEPMTADELGNSSSLANSSSKDPPSDVNSRAKAVPPESQ